MTQTSLPLVLPHWGRGTAEGGGGGFPPAPSLFRAPSTMLRMVPLPLRVRMRTSPPNRR
jgi:hypothetical protein